MKHFFLFCVAMILIMGGCLFTYISYWYFGHDIPQGSNEVSCQFVAKCISGAGSLILVFVVLSQNLNILKWKR
jgi:hypothetical protein